jgi:DNA polymerase-1
MNFIIFGSPQEKYKITILVKPQDLNKDLLLKHYVQPLINLNPSIKVEDFLVLPVDYDGKKAPVKTVLIPCLDNLKEYIIEAGSDIILTSAPEYYKKITGKTKVATLLGSGVDSKYPNLEGIKTFNIPSYRSIFFDEKNIGKIDLALKGVASEFSGNSQYSNIIHKAIYPSDLFEIEQVLKDLLKYPTLTCDIEGFDLKHTKTKVATIAFAWSKHEGTAFVVDLYNNRTAKLLLLYNFFNEYLGRRNGKIIFHNMNFDAKVLIHELFQCGMSQAKGAMLNGIDLFTKNFEDTKIIAYLATNSCSGNELSLKMLALPFTGNYGLNDEAITNILSIPEKDLLEYNLKDALATFYVYEKYYPLMVKDNQEKIYKELFKPAIKNLLQMELHGMPICMERVLEVERILLGVQKQHLTKLKESQYYKILIDIKQYDLTISSNLKWKTKVQSYKDFRNAAELDVNLNSGSQLIDLLYGYCDLPIIDKTETGLPATGGKTLDKLKNHITNNPELVGFIDELINLGKVNKILESFIPAFKDAHYDPITKYHYLFGNFNLGGTVSGRLSCSKPNLQQIPSGSKYAKLIKSCFKAPPRYLMVGLDFNSLEDYISALTTKDPNKLKVYIEGYDGHSLRASFYFKDEILKIDSNFDFTTPEGVNKLKDESVYGSIRQDSKPATFALTYLGTWITLVKNLGFSEELAKRTENNYHHLYQVSDAYVQTRLKQASQDGYIEVAFGLRVRTPMLSKVVWGSSKVPKEAAAESRTAGNALGQSYGLLNTRAGIEFQEKTLESKYRLDIWPIAHIHDAQYAIIKDDMDVLAFVNKTLVKSVRWQELPEIQHDTVKLGGSLGVFYPDWTTEIELPPDEYNPTELRNHVQNKLEEKKKS